MTDGGFEFGDVNRFDTFPKLLAENARRWPDAVAMREKEFGIWNAFTWAECQRRVRLMALGMHKLGLKRGEVVALIGDNRPEWIWGELAAHAMGALSLGIYQDSLGEEVTFLLNIAEARIIVAEDEEQVDKLRELIDETPSVRHIVYCDPRGIRKYDDPRLIDISMVYRLGTEVDAATPELYEQELNAGRGADVAVLCTTSGTTARPKLSMMQAGPFLDHCLAYLRRDPKQAGDNYVSVLPLPWIMEQVYAVAQALISRITVNFVETQETMMADLREIGPSFVLLAPRSWESIAADVRSRMMDASRLKQAMFALGMKLGMRALDAGRRSAFAEALLFRALKDRLGFTSLKSAATGGAALGPDTFRFFLAMGVPLRQLYGQTELAGAYTLHAADDVDFDTVGTPFDNAEVRIDNPDENGVGEIVARTSGMFLGYFKNEEATRADVHDGWMRTGDAGYFKEGNGHLVVIDRIKDIATTDTGARFSPMFIENKLKFSPFIAEVVVLGHDRPYLAAMVCIRFAIVSKWAEQRRIAFTNYTNLAARADVYQLVRGEIERVNATLPAAHRIRRFLLLYKELDADDGELTRTRKVRRGVINQKYGDLIDAIYRGDDSVFVDTTITFQDGSKARIVTDLKVETIGEAPQPAQAAAQ
ncbi:MAG: long-chain fatty acid--CoA ligase [Defluviicoccus sp.]|nr:long-chain fatty acid--CoA ligase [Defluviicoccus sp.]MDG4593772.1 long-chain fatty acid--CoA ligase [Defluviicoccus sp.]MDS4073114.1 long-chain fatty acid--CoA ligase [Defluviicoccus sp.]